MREAGGGKREEGRGITDGITRSLGWLLRTRTWNCASLFPLPASLFPLPSSLSRVELRAQLRLRRRSLAEQTRHDAVAVITAVLDEHFVSRGYLNAVETGAYPVD